MSAATVSLDVEDAATDSWLRMWKHGDQIEISVARKHVENDDES